MSSSNGPPTSAVRPSDDSATLEPSPANSVASEAVSFAPLCVHVAPERAKAQTAPDEPSYWPPHERRASIAGQRHAQAEVAVLVSSLAVSFGPWCVQTPAERVKTHAAPVSSLS